MLLIPTEEKRRMVRKILKIEIVILGCIIAVILWREGYLFCSEASVRRIMAITKFRILYLNGIWPIIKFVWWSAGFLTTIFLSIYYIAGEITENIFDKLDRTNI